MSIAPSWTPSWTLLTMDIIDTAHRRLTSWGLLGFSKLFICRWISRNSAPVYKHQWDTAIVVLRYILLLTNTLRSSPVSSNTSKLNLLCSQTSSGTTQSSMRAEVLTDIVKRWNKLLWDKINFLYAVCHSIWKHTNGRSDLPK